MIIQSPCKNSIFLTFYLFLAAGICYIPISLKILVSLVLFALPFFYFCFDKCVRNDVVKKMPQYWFILFVFLLFQLVNQRFSLSIFFIFSNLILSDILINKSFSTKILLVGYYVIISIYILMILIGMPLDSFMRVSSRNLVSVICLCYLAVIYLVKFKQNEKTSVMPLFFLVIVCVGAVGRGGIICSFGLLSAYIFIKLLHNRLFLIAFIILIMLLILAYFDDIVTLYDGFITRSRFSSEGLESADRDDLILSYISHINFSTFFWGYDYSSDPLFIRYLLNPHNSFLRLHFYFGIFAIVFVFYLLQSICRISFKIDLFMGAFFLILLVRGWIDTIFFFDKYDFIIFSFLSLQYHNFQLKQMVK